MTTQGRRTVRAAITAGAIAALALSSASTASAAPTRNGRCESGEFCLYWGLNRSESVSDFTTTIPNYGASQPTCYEFKGPGRGQYACVKNDAASAWNLSSVTVRLYAGASCTGDFWVIRPGQVINDLGILVNRNQSHTFSSSGSC